jgi:glyoxylase-like metal-dependent hydrolase (beta-lactamase superfamily II)
VHNIVWAMPAGAFKRELGRGERVLPGLWRLRLPLPWPGIPHCNAWAIRMGDADGDGILLIDCGMHLDPDGDDPGSLSQLERAMGQVGLALEQVRKLLITHAHPDHWGQAATVMQRSGCELWMHPNHGHGVGLERDSDSALAHTIEIARAGGVPERTLALYLERIKDTPTGIAAVVAPDHELVNGVSVDSALGAWSVHETPGHAPSEICLFQAERRVLISGDHLLGRISLYYDFGWSRDPIAEYLDSLELVDALNARLCLSGHGKPFTDVRAHVLATRRTVAERLTATRAALDSRPRTALELVPSIYGEQLVPQTASWRLTEALCMLQHLCLQGLAAREADGPAERWYQP